MVVAARRSVSCGPVAPAGLISLTSEAAPLNSKLIERYVPQSI